MPIGLEAALLPPYKILKSFAATEILLAIIFALILFIYNINDNKGRSQTAEGQELVIIKVPTNYGCGQRVQ